MLPNWEFSWVSHLEIVDYVWEMAYTGAVHAVVESTKLFLCSGHHIIDTSLVGYVHLYRCCSERWMRGEVSALFGSGLGTFLIDVCKNHTSRSRLRKSNGCLFANAASGLSEQVREDL